MTSTPVLAYLVVAATLAFVASSFVTPFAGFAPDAFPVPQDSPPSQPAGYAFAIWGIIYLWLIVSAFFGAAWRRMSSSCRELKRLRVKTFRFALMMAKS